MSTVIKQKMQWVVDDIASEVFNGFNDEYCKYCKEESPYNLYDDDDELCIYCNKDIGPRSAYHWLYKAQDIEWILNDNFQFKSANVKINAAGFAVWVCLGDGEVKTYHHGMEARANFYGGDDIEQALESIFQENISIKASSSIVMRMSLQR